MNRYRLIRFEKGLTITAVARQAGVARKTIRELETGETVQMSAATAKALADVYEMSVAELLGVETEQAA